MPVSAEDFRFFEEVGVEAAAGVEDLDADEAVVFPVQDDERLDAFGRVGGDAGAAAAEPLPQALNGGVTSPGGRRSKCLNLSWTRFAISARRLTAKRT